MNQSIITIGGVTQDIFVLLNSSTTANDDSLTLSTATKQEASKIVAHIGGGASNAAVSFARQGFVTSICALRGNDQAGQYVKKELTAAGVNTTALLTHESAPTGTSIILRSPSGQSAITAYRGANSLLCANLVPLAYVTDHPYLYITSLSHHAAALLPTLVTTARPTSTLIACNPGTSQLQKQGIAHLAKALPYIDVLLLNTTEAALCATSLVGPDCTQKVFASHVLANGPHIVGITDGPHGVHVYTADSHLHMPSLATDVVDTVGAGDAFGAGFVGGLIHKLSIKDAIKQGLQHSARVLAQVGSF